MNAHSRSRSGPGGARGQVLPIFAAGLVAILAITALVVDVGFVFMLRRHEQNAADPGALAAARYIPTGDRAAMWTGACAYALLNGPSAPAEDDDDWWITGAVKWTGSSIARTGRKTGASVLDIFRVVKGAVRKALPDFEARTPAFLGS